jgi:hypothetical protein
MATPEQPDEGSILEEVQRAQPGTWPTSAVDLLAGPPEDAPETVRVGASPAEGDGLGPDPDFAYLPAKSLTDIDDPLPRRIPARNVISMTNAAPTFSAIVRIDTESGIHVMDLRLTGTAEYIERMIHEMANTFLDQSQGHAKG